MESIRELRVWALAAMLLCLFGTLQAQSGSVASANASNSSQTYVISLPSRCSQAHKIEVSVGYPATKQAQAAEWDVSVTVNKTECKMYCTYRHKQSPLMPVALLTAPPVATIRMYGVNGPTTAVVVVDPAGLALPDAHNCIVLAPSEIGRSPRRLLIATYAERISPSSDETALRLAALPRDYAFPIAAAVPLRI